VLEKGSRLTGFLLDKTLSRHPDKIDVVERKLFGMLADSNEQVKK
jgi:hypothetical protein